MNNRVFLDGEGLDEPLYIVDEGYDFYVYKID